MFFIFCSKTFGKSEVTSLRLSFKNIIEEGDGEWVGALGGLAVLED